MALQHWLALSFSKGLGPLRVRSLIEHVGSVERLFELSSSEWSQLGIRGFRQEALVSLSDQRVQAALSWCDAEKGRSILSWDSPNYPKLLLEISDPPVCLYVQGPVEALSTPLLAVVGSRHPSSSGLRQAHALSLGVVEQGLGVVSGLALGVDAAAHRGALSGEGLTVAVCAIGLDSVYPSSHRGLAKDIVRKGGVLLSEQGFGVPPHPSLFPRRNRIISGLSLGTLVIEAGLRSGSLITAHLALAQNREVLAVPGEIANPLSKGCHALLKQGAVLVESVRDIILSINVGVSEGVLLDTQRKGGSNDL